MALLDPNRLFPADAKARQLAGALYDTIKDLPIVSPHGHTDPKWFALNENFPDPAELIIKPDHYVVRMLISQGIRFEELGICPSGSSQTRDPKEVWNLFAENYHLFRGTPSALWLDHSFEHVFGIDTPLNGQSGGEIYDHIDACLTQDAYRPRSLFERFNIEAIATTEAALDPLEYHQIIRDSDWDGNVVTAYRPDSVVDPEFDGFAENVQQLGKLTGCDVATFEGYLEAHRNRRTFFSSMGATSTDHGHATARTEDMSIDEITKLYAKILSGQFTAEDADMFRGQMLTEMARMSCEDGLVMQLHCGSYRNHSQNVFQNFGRDRGFDIPTRTDYVHALSPLLNSVGMNRDLTLIVFTLDETSFSRELAPLAGAYPALKLGPPWWFFDSYEGMKRFRETTTETCGFYNTVGFNDDTRAFCSIPARHDVARRCDSAYLADLVTTGRLRETEAFELARDLTYTFVKQAYKL